MKVILGGGTGTIGGAVLRRLVELPSITSIVALSRREIDVKDPKIQTVIVKDFSKYDDDVVAQLAGADACIWALGSPTSGKDVHDGYTWALIDALSTKVVPNLPAGKQFRFVYTSGSAVETDATKTLWFIGGVRKMRGDIQNRVVAFKQPEGAAAGGEWKSFVVRPGFVTAGKPFWGGLVPTHYIPKEVLAAAMVQFAQNGAEKQVFENVECQKIGAEALEKPKL